jgi:hypothetical protein
VTQAFNTTNSMGRLTLNVLLSFAQFEREVIAEHIRDKIAASKKKGMWMGGRVPCRSAQAAAPSGRSGPRARDLRTLPRARHGAEAADGDGAARAAHAAAEQRRRTPCRRRGLLARQAPPRAHQPGGDRPHQARLLQNAAIIDTRLWDEVQDRLSGNRNGRTSRPTANASSPFAGQIFDPEGQPMRPSNARKGDRRYRYYVSRELILRRVEAGATGWRIPAMEIETATAQAVVARLRDPAFTTATLAMEDKPAERGTRLLASLRRLEVDLLGLGSEAGRAALRRIVERVDVAEDRLSARINLSNRRSIDGGGGFQSVAPFTIEQPIVLARRGAQLGLVLQGAAADARPPDTVLVEAIVKARMRFADWRNPNSSATISAVATRHGANLSDVSREMQLMFLAPDLVEQILDGR